MGENFCTCLGKQKSYQQLNILSETCLVKTCYVYN